MTARPTPPETAEIRDDQGFTLIELLVAMIIFSIFLGIFGFAMVNLFHSVNRTQQTAYAQSKVNVTYSKLERELRYVDGISTPTTISGSPTIEFSDSSSGSTTCTELRLTSDGTLMQRSWAQSDGSRPNFSQTAILGSDLSADTPALASDSTASTVAPFARLAATGSANNQRLEIALNARDSSQDPNATTRVRHVDVTMTALNTTTSTASDSVCAIGRSFAWPAS